jgi:predicted Holliday junction resolvase-like endonuclease
MIEALCLGAIALLSSIIYLYIVRRDTQRQLNEYRELFEVASKSEKDALSRVEKLLQDVTRKNLLLERGADAIELAQEEISGLKSQVSFQEEQYAKLFNQKKSSEVRTGKITEQISPFLKDYPLDPRTARFIGDPIDFVHFDADKVTFVEVKSGKSQLNKRQRQIRALIKEGKVDFTVYRVEGK